MSKVTKKAKDFVIVTPSTETQTNIPLTCPVCETVFRNKSDEEEFVKNHCCLSCAINFAYPNISNWKSGWRPSKEQISKYVQNVEFELILE